MLVVPQALLDSQFIDTEAPQWLFSFEGQLFEFSEFERFNTAQRTCGGSKLGNNFKDCLEFLITRHEELHEEALCVEEELGYYTLPMGYCKSGIYVNPENTSSWAAWYFTTSQTLFLISELEGELSWTAVLPPNRGDNHLKLLLAAQRGRTLEQYHAWYNSYLLGSPEREEAYAEESAWWNQHMQEFKPMATLPQLKAKNELRECLRYIYGNWAGEYGIGEAIKDFLGSSDLESLYIVPKSLAENQYEECLLRVQEELIKALDKLVDLQMAKGFISHEVEEVLDWDEYDYPGADEDYDDSEVYAKVEYRLPGELESTTIKTQVWQYEEWPIGISEIYLGDELWADRGCFHGGSEVMYVESIEVV